MPVLLVDTIQCFVRPKGPAPNASRAREAAAQRDGKNPNDADAALKLFCPITRDLFAGMSEKL
jgi:hypothetical protein